MMATLAVRRGRRSKEPAGRHRERLHAPDETLISRVARASVEAFGG